MKEIFSLDDKTALITGGGTGIGKAIAHCMTRAGARVLLVGRHEETLSAACREIGDHCSYIPYDITSLKNADRFTQLVYNQIGLPDILVNNAGIHLKRSVSETTEDQLQQMLNTHVIGAHAVTRAFIPGFIERCSGSVLFITSMGAVFGIPLVSAYSAAKSAQLGLVRAYATELSPNGIRVNAIAPGWIETQMSQGAMQDDPERRQKVLSRTPLGCLGKPEDVGWAAVYLCSSEASFVTGQQLIVDGGISIGF